MASGVRHSAPPPKPTSLGTFLFGDKKVPRRRHPTVSELFSINRIMLRKPDSLKKKIINNSGIPQHEIEHIARCILPDILAYYESEEGQREFREWLAQREAEASEGKVGKSK